MKHSVNVRTIAETYFEGGDLISAFSAIDRMQEGLIGHLLQQNTYTADYRAEVPVKLDVSIEGIDLTVQGRVDGLMLKDGKCLVEEIKTTRLPPYSIQMDDYPVHWAQAEIYAFMLASQHSLANCTVRLVYLNLTGERIQYEREYSFPRLSELFYLYVQIYIDKLKREEKWLNLSIPSVKSSGFPFESFRDGQREMAEASYRTIRDKNRLLCEAPTGIGKTVATLFPAIKALGENHTDVLFYLTARGTGKIAAGNALNLMRKAGLMIRSVSVSAKRKLCPTPTVHCDPEKCPRAKGHFDRQKYALAASWEESAFDEAAIRMLADKYNLCPFELTLALCETAQVIICDYNYVFDPKVRLKRFFDRAGRYTLLIDEAHNLIDRMREMYSAEISAKETSALRKMIGKDEGRQSPLYLSLSQVLRSLGKADEYELRSELPTKTLDALKDFIDTAKQYLGKNLSFSQELTDYYFKASDFVRTSGDFDEESYKLMVTPEGKRNSFKLWCWNPTPHIHRITKKMCGTILFSATLSPIEHYAKLLSVNPSGNDRVLKLRSPFPHENLLCLKLGIATRYSVRAENAGEVARAIHTLALSRTGNYIACFPSHTYLNLVHEAFVAIEPSVKAICQKTTMSETERTEYIHAFQENPAHSMVAFIAMGGVFSEGIDLPGNRLIGAAIVGVGLPQIGFERDALKQMYDDDENEGGFETAYVYPGIGKCLQAAGRVIRTSSDKGVVLFIDERYLRSEYEALLPEHMKGEVVTMDKLSTRLRRFWNAQRKE